MASAFALRVWRNLDRPGWRNFAMAMAALALALLLAIYSGAAAQSGRLWLAACSALGALGVAGWVAFTIVPVLARRTPLRWLAYQIDYKFTRTGKIYVAGVMVMALAALNTGNLLFIVLACLIAGILVSGVASRTVLSGVDVHLTLPEHIFAGQPVMALAELRNHKFWLPSFSLSIVGEEPARPKKSRGKKKAESQEGRPLPAPAAILTRPVFFPFCRARNRRSRPSRCHSRAAGFTNRKRSAFARAFPFAFCRRRAASPRIWKSSSIPP